MENHYYVHVYGILLNYWLLIVHVYVTYMMAKFEKTAIYHFSISKWQHDE